MAQKITISTVVKKPKEQVWEYFTLPEHITRWYFAVPEWHCPKAENDLRNDGKFSYRMEARDGNAGFNFSGTYSKVDSWKEFSFMLDDGREALVTFTESPDGVKVVETFDIEEFTPVDLQEQGWLAILENFRIYAETQ